MLRRGRFLTGAYDEELGVKDVSWLNAGRRRDDRGELERRQRALLRHADGRARAGDRHPPRRLRLDAADHPQRAYEVVPFTLPAALGGSRWVRLIDTSDPDGEALALRDFGHAYEVAGRSLLLFVLQPDRTRDRSTAAERSFQRVFQAMDDAATKSVRFGFD